jgi:8-oxo-dGTP pyrophosphatase MutT (NUDIX family)
MPDILDRKTTRISQWVTLLEKTVRWDACTEPSAYHCLSQAAYVSVLAQLPDQRIAIVRQYRPCVEDYTWEFPAGTLDPAETPEQAARRELLEETGLETQHAIYLGNFLPDTGRLAVDSHVFYVRAMPSSLACERGIEVRFVTHEELKAMIRSRDFRLQLHLAVYASVLVSGLDLDAVKAW